MVGRNFLKFSCISNSTGLYDPERLQIQSFIALSCRMKACRKSFSMGSECVSNISV